MVRPWTPMHGHTHGHPGISLGHDGRYRVKFIRNRKYIHVGYYLTLTKATTAAQEFLRKEKCPSPTPA